MFWNAYSSIVTGYKFPPKDLTVANNAMTDTAIAPEWIDSDVCLRCRDPFTFTNRKHHCRNCGQVFDQKCSSKNLPLPHFGIPQEVRVCDSCHFKLTRKKEAAAKEIEDAKKKAAQQQHRAARQDHIDYDLARAIELSLKESSHTGQNRAGYAPLGDAPKQWVISEPPLVDKNPGRQQDDDDEELRLAIEASLREAHAPHPSAPVAEPEPANNRFYDSPVASVPSYELAPQESDTIMTFNQTVSDAQTYGLKDMRQTHELYTRANTLRPKLTMSLDDTERKEREQDFTVMNKLARLTSPAELLSEMHDKLSQAVKMYDNLLNEQFVQSSRRQQTYSQPTYGQYAPQPQQNQWVPPSAASYASPYATMQTPASSTLASNADQRWAPANAYQPETNQALSTSTYPQYTPERSVISPPPVQPVTLPPSSAPAHVTQFQTQQYPTYTTSLPPVTLPQVPSSAYQYPAAGSSSPAPVSQPPVANVAQSPPVGQQQPSLSRHNTLQSYHPSHTSLQRSNTVATPTGAHHGAYQAQQPQYQQPQQQRAAVVSPPPSAPPVSLPVLPTAPTNAPSAYSLYGASVPNVPNAAPAEPKEAMLISFD